MLLRDVDHGVVHDLDLVMTRRDGRLVAITAAGRRIWGAADAAFAEGLDGLPASAGGTDGTGVPAGGRFTGVHPIDEPAVRRPMTPGPDRAAGAQTGTAGGTVGRGPAVDPLTPLLARGGASPLPEAMHVNGERMDMAYAVGVLMGARDLRRRLAAEARGEPVLAA